MEIEITRTTKRLVEPDHQQHDALENDLLDTNVVPELRRPRPHRGVLNWIGGVPADRLFLSAVTVGEIQAGIEIARERDAATAEKLETRLDRVVSGYGVLPMEAPAFREWARLKHGKSDTPIEDAMIAATARVRRLTVATRNVRDLAVQLFSSNRVSVTI